MTPRAMRPTNARIVAFSLALLLGALLDYGMKNVLTTIRGSETESSDPYGDRCWH